MDKPGKDKADRQAAGDEAEENGDGLEPPQQPNVNQVQHEPVPASHHEHRRPAAVEQNEAAAAASAPEGRWCRERAAEDDSRQDTDS